MTQLTTTKAPKGFATTIQHTPSTQHTPMTQNTPMTQHTPMI